MEKVRFALVQLAWPGERAPMMKTYHELVAAAAKDGAQIVGLPELSISPYFPGRRDPQGFQWAEPLHGGASDQFFSELAQEYGVYILGSIFEKADDGYWDTATVHNPEGALIASTRKVHIPSGEGYHETDFFQSATDYPVHDIGLLRLAVPTCYDQWFPELARIYALNGAEFIFYPTAIGSEPTDPDFDSQVAWQTVMRGHAIANGIFIAAANRIGHENDVTFYGSSFICDPTGCILAQAGRDTTEYIIADLEPRTMQRYRNLFPLLHQRKPHTYNRLTEAVNTPPPARWNGEL
ncbi:MAG: hydrolase [Chloroflexi bacterium]|nr:MAG: hydrolase [Chloroflexota bacterium]